MEMMIRARVFTALLTLCAIANLALVIYPEVLMGSKWLHAAFLIYALLGIFIFRWILKIGRHDPVRGDKLFIRCIFAYWGIPVLFGYFVMFITKP
jgi:hypothetical protein